MKRMPGQLRKKTPPRGRNMSPAARAMVNPFHCTFAAFLIVIGAVSTAPAQVVVYEDDFSSDPGWLTDQPANFYWDGAAEAYFARTLNGRPEYAPNRYGYIPVPLDSALSFDLQWDQKMLSAGTGTRSPFGLMSPDLMVSNVTYNYLPHLIPESTVNLWMGAWSDPMPGDSSIGVNAIDASGYNAGFGSYSGAGGHYGLDLWYRNALSYDPLENSIDWSITERDSGNLIWSGLRTFPSSAGFSSNMVNLGVGNDPFGYHPTQLPTVNPDEYAEALFDNILLTTPGTPPHEPGIYGLFVGVDDPTAAGAKDALKFYDTISNNVANWRDGYLFIRDIEDGGIAAEEIETLVNGLLEEMSPGDTFIFYAAGHGTGEGNVGGGEHADEKNTVNTGDEALILTQNSDDYFWDDTLTRILSVDKMEEIEKWVFLDGCGTGGFWGNYNPDDEGDLEKLSKIGLFAAAAEGADAVSDWPTYEGLFTSALVDAFSIDSTGNLRANLDDTASLSFEDLTVWLQERDWLNIRQDPFTVWKRDLNGGPMLFSPDMWSPVSFASDDFTGSSGFEPVPAPGAFLLGAIGLAFANWRLRKHRTV